MIDQLNNQSRCESTNQSINQSSDQTINRSAHQLFDFIYIDANKSAYQRYFDRLIDMLIVDGLMVFDNTLFKGDVIAAQPNKKLRLAEKLHIFNQSIKQSDRVLVTMLPIRDGITVVQKKY